MLRKKTVMMTIAGMLLMAGTALADGTPGAGVPTEHSSGQGGESHDMGHEADTRGSHTQATSSAGSEPVPEETSAAEGHSHGSEADLVETPANVRVLGSFAALNGAFLIIGAWNKFGPKPERTEGQQHE